MRRRLAKRCAKRRVLFGDGDEVDREDALKEVWRSELLARLRLLDQQIIQQASRTRSVHDGGWDPAVLEKRSMLVEKTRLYYVALLERLVLEEKLPLLWNELDPSSPALT